MHVHVNVYVHVCTHLNFINLYLKILMNFMCSDGFVLCSMYLYKELNTETSEIHKCINVSVATSTTFSNYYMFV